MYRSKIIHLTHVIFHFFVNKEDSTLIKLYTIAVINISNFSFNNSSLTVVIKYRHYRSILCYTNSNIVYFLRLRIILKIKFYYSLYLSPIVNKF